MPIASTTLPGRVLGVVTLLLGLAASALAVRAQEAATPVPVVAVTPAPLEPHPARIQAGTCDALAEVTSPLGDVRTADAQTLESLGAVGLSSTTLETPLDDLLVIPQAITVHESAVNLERLLVCGEVIGAPTDGQVVVALQELDGSGYRGEAVLEEVGDGTTTVSVVLMVVEAERAAAPGATPATAAEFQVGTVAATTEDNVRLRAEPTTDAEIVDALAAGTQLQVIGGPEEAEGYTWYEVTVLDSPEPVRGWVAADFVESVTDAD